GAAGDAGSAQAGPPDERVEAAAPAREHADQARHRRADFGPARRSRRDYPRAQALSVPGHRRDRLPRARPRRDRVSIRARDALRGSGDRGGSHGGAPRGPRPPSARKGRSHPAPPAPARRRRHRLSAARHEPPAGAGPAVVSVDESEGVLMLSFLAPLFLAGAAAAAVPIVLHLLKREPEPRVQFAAVKLLKQAPVEHTQTRRLRELILLAIRVAAIVLLAAAFARPFLASGAAIGSAGVTIVALDTSYSM